MVQRLFEDKLSVFLASMIFGWNKEKMGPLTAGGKPREGRNIETSHPPKITGTGTKQNILRNEVHTLRHHASQNNRDRTAPEYLAPPQIKGKGEK